MLNRPGYCMLMTLIAVSISSCVGTQVKPGDVTPSAKTTRMQLPETQTPKSSINPKDLLAQALQKTSPEREKLQLQAARIYVDQRKIDKAQNLINEVKAAELPDNLWVIHSEISALLALHMNDVETARRILTNPRIERHLNALEPQQEASLRTTRAQVFERAGQLNESVIERINLTAILTNREANTANQEALWQTLMAMPLATLQHHAAQGAGGITQGWYALAALSKNNTQNLERQQAQLNQWLAQWPNHPANGNLPKGLSLIPKVMSKQPHNIALLLPLKGRLAEAGQAVSDGFFAAYYQTLSEQSSTATSPNIRQYDTSTSATTAYQQAVTDGADLIIGPLDKDDVNQLSRLASLPVAVLSLNYISAKESTAQSTATANSQSNNIPALTQPPAQPSTVMANFYQFGLAAEDEARQVARQGIQDGHQRALVVLSTQEWSERSAQAFSAEWEALGGTIIQKTLFNTQDQFSAAVRNVMLIESSQARMNLLRQQLATKLEFTPRHRDDIDMIFMAATPVQGRQIKPTLAFHDITNIPLYATSNIYSGDIDAVNNDDLNGVIFTTLPWLFDTNNPVKEAISLTTKSSAVYSRLHALGADAFHLHARLSQLQQAPEMRLYGATGALHLLADGRVEHEQIWAHFKAGLAEPIARVITSDENEAGE